MRFYSESLSPGSKRSETPEGYLVIEDVPIARVGEQLYAPHEVGLDGDRDGVVRVQRDPDEVFRPETIASAAGKDVVNDHPTDGRLLNAKTWRSLTCGTMLNPRRGEGAFDGFLLCDLIIKDPDAIRDVYAGKKEVSAGYDCEYEQTGPGRGRQRNIIINHTALVDAGRCGERCSLGDRLPHQFRARSHQMAVATLDRRPARGTLRRFADRLRRAVATGDEESIAKMADELETEAGEEGYSEHSRLAEPGEEGSGGELHVHVHTGDEDELGEHGPDDDDMTGDRRTRDRSRRRGRDAELAPEGDEPDGDEPATKMDIAQLAMMIRELMDADDEDEDLDGEEGDGGEVADRRREVHDRRRKARDKLRKFADEVGEIVETKHNPDSAGRNDAPGTAGSGAKGIKSEPVHRSDAPGASDRRTVGDRATMDSRSLESAWQTVVSQAEILAPGVEVYESGRKIAFDAAAPLPVTERRICALRRRALDAAAVTREGRAVLDQVTTGQVFNLRTVGCDALTPVFNAASALMAERNRQLSRTTIATADATIRTGLDVTPADMNKRNRERFASKAALR